MAGGKDDEESLAEKRNRREHEDEVEQAQIKKGPVGGRLGSPSFVPVGGPPASAEDLMRRAQPMIDQINGLYRQYSLGLEKFPPNVLRKQLESLLDQLQKAPKANPSEQFRANSLKSSYITYREKWDRLLKDIESGKIKRV